MHQLTNHPKLAKHILETYKPGDQIRGAYCLKEGSHPQFTIQTSLVKFFEVLLLLLLLCLILNYYSIKIFITTSC